MFHPFQGGSLNTDVQRSILKSAYAEFKLVEMSGIEPLASCVQGRRSPS